MVTWWMMFKVSHYRKEEQNPLEQSRLVANRMQRNTFHANLY